jgi:PIN domain nuclease of toxin-antitoxin system
MKLLLDTHIFIWWADQPEKLSPAALSALEDEANELLLSVASVWEMQIKIQLGKLKLSLPLKDLVKNQQETNGITVTPVALAHVLALDALPFQSQRSVRSFADCSKYGRRPYSCDRRFAVFSLFG